MVKAANLMMLEISLNISQTPQSFPSQGMMSPRFESVSANTGAKKINKIAKEAATAKTLLNFLLDIVIRKKSEIFISPSLTKREMITK